MGVQWVPAISPARPPALRDRSLSHSRPLQTRQAGIAGLHASSLPLACACIAFFSGCQALWFWVTSWTVDSQCCAALASRRRSEDL